MDFLTVPCGHLQQTAIVQGYLNDVGELVVEFLRADDCRARSTQL